MNIQKVILALRGQSIEDIQDALNTFTIEAGNIKESDLNYCLALYDAMMLSANIYRADKSELKLDAYRDAKSRYDNETRRQESKISIVRKF